MTEDYRSYLITAEQKSQDSYDKAIIYLSGGALAISLIFIRDIIGEADPERVYLAVLAWASWALSVATVVCSYFFSRKALRKAIEQADQNNFEEGVGKEQGVRSCLLH